MPFMDLMILRHKLIPSEKRDNLIKSLEKSKAELEAQLARVLNNQVFFPSHL